MEEGKKGKVFKLSKRRKVNNMAVSMGVLHPIKGEAAKRIITLLDNPTTIKKNQVSSPALHISNMIKMVTKKKK